MEFETIRMVQGIAYVVITILLVLFLYSYIFYLYRAQRTGKVDYEKYAYLALDDDINDKPIQERSGAKSSTTSKH